MAMVCQVAPGPVQLLPELQPFKPHLNAYVQAQLHQFWLAASSQLQGRHGLSPNDCERLLQQTLAEITQVQQPAVQEPASLSLLLCHDCRPSGCGAGGCSLCQYNRSRPCARNTKLKYLEGDVLRATCDAPLRVVVVDRQTGVCHQGGLPAGITLEMHILNGERYEQHCEPLSVAQLRECIVNSSGVKGGRATLERRGASGDSQQRLKINLEDGAASLSDVMVTCSSTAMLGGRGSSFKLLVWAVDAQGEPVPGIAYAASESFMVATRRMRVNSKPQVPLVTDDITKLENVGKATAEKLHKLGAALQETGMAHELPAELHSIRTVGQCKALMEVVEGNRDLSCKLRALLKLAPEAWEELRAHAASALENDSQRRVWWCSNGNVGLVFECEKGAVKLEHPTGMVTCNAPTTVCGLGELRGQLDALKQQAAQAWRAQGHPGWALLQAARKRSSSDGGSGSPSHSHSRTPSVSNACSSPPLSLDPHHIQSEEQPPSKRQCGLRMPEGSTSRPGSPWEGQPAAYAAVPQAALGPAAVVPQHSHARSVLAMPPSRNTEPQPAAGRMHQYHHHNYQCQQQQPGDASGSGRASPRSAPGPSNGFVAALLQQELSELHVAAPSMPAALDSLLPAHMSSTPFSCGSAFVRFRQVPPAPALSPPAAYAAAGAEGGSSEDDDHDGAAGGFIFPAAGDSMESLRLGPSIGSLAGLESLGPASMEWLTALVQ